MRNCLILGSGRSGTSLAAGMLAKSGYFMGRSLSQERESNLITNFEDIEINRLNENLLAQVLPPRLSFLGRSFFRDRPAMWQRWLARVPMGTEIPPLLEAVTQIQELTTHEPYCFKDPRFSYVLPVWKPYLKNIQFICVFRDPVTTTQSILKLVSKASYLHNLSITYEQALEVWTLMYSHILSFLSDSNPKDWLFIHYNQLLTSDGQKQLLDFTETYAIDSTIIDSRFQSSRDTLSELSKKTLKVYKDLLSLTHNFYK